MHDAFCCLVYLYIHIMKLILLSGAGHENAQALAERLSCVCISQEDIYRSISRAVRAHESRKRICYEILFRLLDRHKNSTTSIVLDYPTASEQEIDAIRTYAAQNNIECSSVGERVYI